MSQHWKWALLLAIMTGTTAAHGALSVRVVSSDPSRVTGGDALIEINATGGAPKVLAGDHDVSAAFKPTVAPGQYLGLVTGLAVGETTVAVAAGTESAAVKVKNFPITGPVFAGPKEKPFFCETATFKLADGTTLGAPLDADCSAKTVVSYVYRAKGEKTFKPLPSRTTLPADIAETTTSTGTKVPYVVRVEAGTIDRGIYQIAVLHDPTSEKDPSANAPPKGWNKRMVYVFAGGCLGMYRQGGTTGKLVDDQFLSLGYLTAANSLNVFQNNCDDLLAAEAFMMTRERAFEAVGAPLYTLGWGCSGGSHQVLMIADNYPGLLDGIVPMCNSVDWTRFQQFYTDVQLVYDWFGHPTAAGLTEEQKIAIVGTPLQTKASALARSRAGTCPDVVPKDQVYDRENNPNGVRCTITEHQVNVVGRDPKTGIARALVDNVGVQYGLGALNAGIITPKQFLDLNAFIGGYDVDGERSDFRSVADPVGLEAYYSAGRVLHGGLGLRNIPIVELRNYSDLDDDAAHTKYGTYAAMARLERESGQRANYIVLLESHREGFMSASQLGGDTMSHFALNRFDMWLTALAADTGPGTRAEKMARTKPADLVDSCYDPEGKRIIEAQTVSGGRCNELYPTHLPPRMVAGGPLTSDVLKCALKPVTAADYKVAFNTDEMTRLRAVFPEGVCDWTKKGVGQVPPKGTWQSF